MEVVLQPWRPPSLACSCAASSRPPAQLVVVVPIRMSWCRTASWHQSWAQPRLLARSSGRGCSVIPAAATGAGPAAPGVTPPAWDYDFRAATATATAQTVAGAHPELVDLVEEGTLVVVRRPPDYVERRSDGYVEPEVVYLVGTAHLSTLSAAQVTRVINSVRPDNVVVELCRSRAGIMYDEAPSSSDMKQARTRPSTPNLMSMSGDNFGSAVGRSLKLGGRSALALRLVLAAVSNRLSDSAGVPTGEEFRAARKAAEVVGAQIVLGDRPIEITVTVKSVSTYCKCPEVARSQVIGRTNTYGNKFSTEMLIVLELCKLLQRAWKSLRWDERLRFAVLLLQSTTDKNLDVSEESLQALKSDDALSAMFGELSSRFPSLLQPLIHERDMYLAWSLKRSKAVNGCKRVVGVVGKGHLRGVVHALQNDQAHLRFRDLVGPRPAPPSPASRPLPWRKLATSLAIQSALGFLLCWAWASFFQPH